MKPKTGFANTPMILDSLATTRLLLAEMSYFIFTPSPAYTALHGFIALRAKSDLYPEVIRVHSRGSFIEATFSELLFSKKIIERLRKNILVPLRVSKTELPEEENLNHYVCPKQHCELEQLIKNARLP